MKDKYKKMGFKEPQFLENQYGIRIYFGTDGGGDWCVSIPRKLVIAEIGSNFEGNFTYYNVTESYADKIIHKYMNIAERIMKNEV